MKLPEEIKICEVGPRDGFQNIRRWIPTEEKIKIIDGLIAAKFKKIEITSFVHPKAIPQMQDAKEVSRHIIQENKEKDIIFNALVPNLYGAEQAWEAGLQEVTFVISASEKHNQENVNKTIEESFEELKRIKDSISDLKIKVDIATAFGCPYVGDVPVRQVLSMIEHNLELNVDEICLCDTIGIANPLQVSKVIEKIRKGYSDLNFSLHLHDTRGMGLANVLVALKYGINVFETALGGLGGCPFAPGAAGNIASEDFINMVENMGIYTGIDLDKLLNTVEIVENQIILDVSSHLSKIEKCRR
ncbi:MAG: hydroxymethylglutaryl-CoA lyase [Peptococcaceae bacterium]